MFQRDQSEISRYALTGPDQMARVITFVYLTIQQSITTVPDAMRSVDREGVESRFLWGFKLDAYEWLSENKVGVYEASTALWRGIHDPEDAARETLMHFASLPGLGLIKGGFCNQLIYGTTGCLDTHNQVRLGISEYRFKSSRFKALKPASRSKMAQDYIDACRGAGGPEHLWDSWCGYVGERIAMSADKVSALHTQAIL